MRTEYAEIHELAKAVARELGNGWTYDAKGSRNADGELHWLATIVGPDHMSLHIGRAGHRQNELGKVEVRGRFPDRDTRGEYHRPDSFPSIRVAQARGPKAVANAITGRLLPSYKEALSAQLARLERANEHIASTDSVIDALRPFGRVQNNRNKIWLHHIKPHDSADPEREIYGDAEVCGAHVSLDLRSLSVDEAVRVLSILGKPAR